MARTSRQRLWTEAACYHVFNRGHNRVRVFHDDDDRAYFLQLLDRYRQRFALSIYHYCLMDNHFHLLLQLADARRISSMAAGLTLAYSHHHRRRYQSAGALWQGRFKSPAIEMEGYLLSCGRYIERNPLDARLVRETWDYRWSSCRVYVLGKLDGLLSPNPYYEELGATPARRQALWQQFLMDQDPKEAEIRKDDWAIGSDDFRRQARRHRGRAQPKRDGRPTKRESQPGKVS